MWWIGDLSVRWAVFHYSRLVCLTDRHLVLSEHSPISATRVPRLIRLFSVFYFFVARWEGSDLRTASRLSNERVQVAFERLDIQRLDIFGELHCKLRRALHTRQVYRGEIMKKFVAASGV